MKYLFYILFLFSTLDGGAQRIDEGMKMPDLTVRLANYKKPVLKLSELRPRLVILDFWNTHCYGCMAAFPHLDSLQRRFGDSIQIILVNRERPAETEGFFVKHPKIHRPQLPMIMGDTSLIRHFTREGYPYSVWIDGAGLVRHITTGYNTTEAHVRGMLAGSAVAMKRSVKSKQVSWLTTEPWKDQVAFFSVFAHWDPQAHEVGALDVDSGRFAHIYYSAPLIRLFQVAWSENEVQRFYWKGSLEAHVRDSAAFIWPRDNNLKDEWRMRYGYNYELVVPVERRADVYALMRGDLERLVGVRAGWEKRALRAYTLIRIDTIDRLKSAGGTPSGNLGAMYNEFPKQGSMRVLKNRPFTSLVNQLKGQIEGVLERPFVDETGYSGAIDMAIPWDTIDAFDLQSWRTALRKYGLDLVEKMQTLDVLVIRDR